MKVIHTIPSLGVNSGGPSLSTTLLVSGLRQFNDVDILTYDVSSESDHLISTDEHIKVMPASKVKRFAFSRQYREFLKRDNSYDLYHLQGVWQYPTFIGAKVARQKNKPYIITPRGMLYPQAIAHNSAAKKVFLSLFLKRDLNKAACVHATCIEEMHYLRDLGVTSPIAVVPNSIRVTTPPDNVFEGRSIRRVGYLGRISRRKNIEALIYAINDLGKAVADYEFLIMGNGDKEYEDFLRTEVKRLKLKNVVFTGFLSGEDKVRTIQSLSCLVVPSNFENFGMIIAEALINKVPVIASKGTPWEELLTHKCGWWVQNDNESIKNAMSEMISCSDATLQQMGENGYELIKTKYSVDSIASKMNKIYQWINNGVEKPGYIYGE